MVGGPVLVQSLLGGEALEGALRSGPGANEWLCGMSKKGLWGSVWGDWLTGPLGILDLLRDRGGWVVFCLCVVRRGFCLIALLMHPFRCSVHSPAAPRLALFFVFILAMFSDLSLLS